MLDDALGVDRYRIGPPIKNNIPYSLSLTLADKRRFAVYIYSGDALNSHLTFS